MTKHKEGCTRVFSRYDNSCFRCIELINGAEPRKGWGWQKKQYETNRLAEIKKHDCIKSNCGVVCTAFDW